MLGGLDDCGCIKIVYFFFLVFLFSCYNIMNYIGYVMYSLKYFISDVKWWIVWGVSGVKMLII